MQRRTSRRTQSARNSSKSRESRLRLEELESRRLLSASQVVGRYLFYDQSKFDGQVAGPNTGDDAAISDKVAYLPGAGVAGAEHVSNYSRGINGVMIDITGSHPNLTADDFVFRWGSSGETYASWPLAAAPSQITVRGGAGVAGSDRVVITWPSDTLRGQWLEVIVRAGEDSGLEQADVFLFGSRPGDAFVSPPPTVFTTTAADELAARFNSAIGVGVNHVLDYDKSGVVSAADQLAARFNAGITQRVNIPAINLDLTAELANDTAPGGTQNNDGITSDPTVVADIIVTGGYQVFASLDGGVAVDLTSLVAGGQLIVDASVYATLGGGPLADGAHELRLELVDAQGRNVVRNVNLTLLSLDESLQLWLTSEVSITNDRTPHLTVEGSGSTTWPIVKIDVDLNYDGDFDDPGERDYGTTDLYEGRSYFQLNPALPATNELGEAYYVQLRTRVEDVAGNATLSAPVSLHVDTLGSTALEDYINTPDPSYGYTLSRTIAGSGYTLYVLDMKSQTWRSAADVNKTVWQHWVQLIVPTGALKDTATLYITGGSTRTTPPTTVDAQLAQLAVMSQSVYVVLPTVPNQPLTFTGDPGNPRTEDEIISYTFRQFLDNLGSPGNETWPALLPMVKSAVAAMDATQSFIPTVRPTESIDDFLVTGYSKRGWTTWLTAAVDDRVRAIVPGVIDMLNLDEQMKHHYEFYGTFSSAIHDYVDQNVVQEIFTPESVELGRIVDPYSYFAGGRFDDMPKLLLNSSGDEFFVPDSAQFYFDDIPGTQNYLRYIPNTGHGLDSFQAGMSTFSFYDAVVNNHALPQFSWTTRWDGQITVESITAPTAVKVWRATNPSTRDFRNSVTGLTWTSTNVSASPDGKYRAEAILPPGGGAHAFFIELTFPSPSGVNFVFTTQVSVVDTFARANWPYFMPVNPPPGAPLAAALAAEDANAVAVALSLDSGEAAFEAQPFETLPAVITMIHAPTASAAAVLYEFDVLDSLLGDIEDSAEEEAVDELLEALS